VAHIVSLDGFSPYGITITEGLGLVLVFAVKGEDFTISVFNINGLPIRKVNTPCRATAWTTWVRDGLDYLLVAWENGLLGVAEAFVLDFKDVERFRAASSPIIAVRHLPEELGIVALTASATITFLPYRHSE
jgi:hypothetical protein